MCIHVLYGSGYVGLDKSGSPGLYGTRASDLMKMGRELVGEWRSAWAIRLFRIAWHAPEDSVSREDGWGKGS